MEVFTEGGQSLAVEEITFDLLYTNLALDVDADRVYEIRSHGVYLRTLEFLLPGPAVILYVAGSDGDVVGEQAVAIIFG